jgi:hypothetical protein
MPSAFRTATRGAKIVRRVRWARRRRGGDAAVRRGGPILASADHTFQRV